MQRDHRVRNFSQAIGRTLGPYDLWLETKGVWRCRCPIHSVSGDGNKTSFRIKQDGRWVCFACHRWGGFADLLMHLSGVSFQQANALLENLPETFSSLDEVLLLPPREELLRRLKYPLLSEAVMGPYRGNCSIYLLNRKFSTNVLKLYGIGYDVQQGRIVIPARDHSGRLVGVTYRVDYEGSSTWKYFHEHFTKAQHLWGFHFWANNEQIPRVYIVEGQLDSVRMHQLGHAACSIMGSFMSDDQVEILNRYCKTDVTLMFDNDEAGKKCTQETVRKLMKTRFGRNLTIACYDSKDPGELTVSKVDLKHWSGDLIPASRPRKIWCESSYV